MGSGVGTKVKQGSVVMGVLGQNDGPVVMVGNVQYVLSLRPHLLCSS